MTSLLLCTVALVLIAEFVNGWTDAPNAIATVVSTSVLPPRIAILMAVIMNILGTMYGTAVATTIGTGFVDASAITLKTLSAGMLGLILWGLIAAYKGLPISKSHALVAGLAGAGLGSHGFDFAAGFQTLLWIGWLKVLIGLIFSTLIGFSIALFLAKLIQRYCARSNSSRAKSTFNKLQMCSSMLMAFMHGSNDGQKFVGVLTITLVLGGILPTFAVTPEVVLVCALVMGLGTSCGGWKIIKTVGKKISDLTSWQGFSAELGASSAIYVASHFGIPLSTTHTITTSVMGVGASRSFSAVRWDIVRKIVQAWAFTFLFCGLVSCLCSMIFFYAIP